MSCGLALLLDLLHTPFASLRRGLSWTVPRRHLLFALKPRSVVTLTAAGALSDLLFLSHLLWVHSLPLAGYSFSFVCYYEQHLTG